MNKSSTQDLIRLLQNAYSGEKAAAYAYRGHAESVSIAIERDEIRKIEQEEWEHRDCLLKMLTSLGAKPRFSRELVMTTVGVVIYFLCRLGGVLNVFNFGWFMSMYGAGKLERSNIGEYEVAALMARSCGQTQFIDDLIHMAEVEWDHEMYFRSKTVTSKWTRIIPLWSLPPPRNSTRQKILS
jgi:hypothetical protein